MYTRKNVSQCLLKVSEQVNCLLKVEKEKGVREGEFGEQEEH